MLHRLDRNPAWSFRRGIGALAALVVVAFATLAVLGAADGTAGDNSPAVTTAPAPLPLLDAAEPVAAVVLTGIARLAELSSAAIGDAAPRAAHAATMPVRYGTWAFVAIALVGVGAILGVLALLIGRLNAAEREIARRAEVERALRDKLAVATAAAERASELNRTKSQFFAQVTHELRTPLNAILGFSEALRAQLFGPVANARYLEYAGLIYDAGGHLLSLINDLLDNSRIEAGKMEIAPVRASAAALVRSALDLVELLAQRRNIATAAFGLEACPDLNVDPRAMKQVLVNLLSNAIKYTPAGGRVEVRAARRDDGRVAIAIADTGIGMSGDDLRVAFEPFGRAAAAEARRQQGTGLGLSLARSLVRLHGGELTLASRPASGTTATIILPASAVLPAEPLPQAKAAAA
jgi:signal transduction histidine kinase